MSDKQKFNQDFIPDEITKRIEFDDFAIDEFELLLIVADRDMKFHENMFNEPKDSIRSPRLEEACLLLSKESPDIPFLHYDIIKEICKLFIITNKISNIKYQILNQTFDILVENFIWDNKFIVSQITVKYPTFIDFYRTTHYWPYKHMNKHERFRNFNQDIRTINDWITDIILSRISTSAICKLFIPPSLTDREIKKMFSQSIKFILNKEYCIGYYNTINGNDKECMVDIATIIGAAQYGIDNNDIIAKLLQRSE